MVENSERSARLVKARLERTLLGQVGLRLPTKNLFSWQTACLRSRSSHASVREPPSVLIRTRMHGTRSTRSWSESC